MSKNVGQLNVKLTADKKPLEQSVDSAVNKLHEAQDELQKTDASSLDTLKQTIGSVFSSLKGLGAQAKQEFNSMKEPINTINDDIKSTSDSIRMMRLPLDEFASELNNLDETSLKELFDKVSLELNESKINAMQLKTELSKLANNKINKKQIADLKAVIKETGVDTQNLRTRLSLLKNTLKTIQSNNIKDIGKNMKDSNKAITEAGDNINGSFKKGFKSLKRFGLALVGIRTAVGYVTSAMRTYISSSDTLTAKTEGISQALAQSLAPYAEIAVGVLQKLVHWVILGIGYFTTFINALFGTNIALKGINGSMKSLTKNTKNAAKAAQDSTAPFDEFNILQEDKDAGGASAIAPDFTGLGIDTQELEGLNAFKASMEEFANSPLWQTIKSNWELITAILLVVVATIAILTGAWGIAIAAIIAFVIMFWDEIVAVAKAIWETIKELGIAIYGLILSIIGVIGGLVRGLYELIASIVMLIWDVIKAVLNSIWELVELVIIDIIVGAFKLVFNTVSDVFNGIWNIIKTIFNGIKDFISKILQGDIAGAFESLKNTITTVFSIIWQTIKNIFSNIWDFISGIASGIADVFVSVIRGIVNSIISFAQNTINGFIKAINVAIKIINAIPGVEIRQLSLLNIPRLASGTVAKEPMVAEIGEYSGAKSNPEIVSPRDMMYDTMVKALKETKQSSAQEGIDMTIRVKYEDGKTIIKKINTAQNDAGKTLLEV
jgi:phage-related protein